MARELLCKDRREKAKPRMEYLLYIWLLPYLTFPESHHPVHRKKRDARKQLTSKYGSDVSSHETSPYSKPTS